MSTRRDVPLVAAFFFGSPLLWVVAGALHRFGVSPYVSLLVGLVAAIAVGRAILRAI